MAILERSYNVPLRKQWLKVPKYKRAQRAVKALRQFLYRHMKTDDDNLKLGPYINEFIWQHGMRNPPHHVKVNAHKQDDGIVLVELDGKPMIELKKKEEKKEKSKIEEKIESVIGKKKEASKPSAKKLAKEKAAEKKSEKVTEKVEEKAVEKAEEVKPESEFGVLEYWVVSPR